MASIVGVQLHASYRRIFLAVAFGIVFEFLCPQIPLRGRSNTLIAFTLQSIQFFAHEDEYAVKAQGSTHRTKEQLPRPLASHRTLQMLY
jgi:hypothetical protein